MFRIFNIALNQNKITSNPLEEIIKYDFYQSVTILDWTSVMTGIATVIAVIIAIISLIKQYKWNRKHYATDLIKQYNDSGRIYTKIIVKYFELKPNEIKIITKNQSEELINEKTDKKKIDCREAIYCLLNFFEYVTVSVTKGVADKNIINDSLFPVMKRWENILSQFINYIEKDSGINYWKPFSDYIKDKKNGPGYN